MSDKLPRRNAWRHLRNTPHDCPSSGTCTACLCLAYITAKEINWKPKTVGHAMLHLTYFAQACPVLPTEPEPIEHFLANLRIRSHNYPGRRGKKVSATYRHNIGRSIGQVYKWATKRNKISTDVWLSVEKPVRPRTEPYWLEEAELELLLTHPGHSDRERALLFVLADTGMRIGEAASLTVGNLSHDRAIVHGKTGMRIVPLRPQIVDMVRAGIPVTAKSDDCVWWGKRGPMSINGLKWSVTLAFKRAGFEGAKMTPHRLRHAFATLWTGADADAMDIGGWHDWDTYRIYRTLRTKRLAAAMAEHSPLAHLLAAPDRPFTTEDRTRLDALSA